VNTASNLEILAQLVPFMISWPNQDVQQMMLGQKLVTWEGCHKWRFPEMEGREVPENCWFIMENPIKIWFLSWKIL